MSTSDINAYLEKEIIIGGKVVTYRLLSRKLSIHVNAAKNALTSFYSRKRAKNEPIYATFWLSGEPCDQATNGSGDDMDVDGAEIRDWSRRKVMIVGEQDLDRVRTTLKETHAIHLYSLSTTPIDGPSQLCEPSREVHELDKFGDDGLARTVGKIVSKHVKRGPLIRPAKKPTASNAVVTSKSRTSSPSITKQETPKSELKPSQSLKSVGEEKPKASGTLSWARAKPKVVQKEQPTVRTAIKIEEVKPEQPVSNGQKRGTKRKSDVRKEEEIDQKPDVKPGKDIPVSNKTSSVATFPSARIKKGVVLSDDEEEGLVANPKRPIKVAVEYLDDSDAEQSVRAMMDLDDSLVTKASKPTYSSISHEDEGEEPPPTDHAESAMDDDSDDPAPKAKPRKRQQKKNIPIGRNGLRKRRVVKSKTDFDEKGYMVTVDYSSYESVDEEDEEEEPRPQKSRAKLKPVTTKKKIPVPKAGDASASETDIIGEGKNRGPIKKAEPKKVAPKKPPLKPTASKDRQTNGSQKSLASFFAPGGGKAKK